MNVTGLLAVAVLMGFSFLGAMLFVGVLLKNWKLDTVGQGAMVAVCAVCLLIFVVLLMLPGPVFSSY